MRKGWASLALQVQEVLGQDPHSGNLYIFRGRRSDLIKVIWHDGQGMCLFAKRLERGRFIWPSPADGVVAISAGQMGDLLEGIDWRMPQKTWRPEAARAVAQISSTEAIIASLRLEIEKLRREIYGQRSERKARLLEQMEFQLEELEATASADELTAEQAAAKTTAVKAFTRQRSEEHTSE